MSSLLLRPIQCENCKATFKTESALGLHLCYDQYIPKKKYGEPYKCEKCNKNYQNRKTFRYHLQSAHTAEKKYKCDKCGFSTKTSSALSSHVHRVHTKVELVKEWVAKSRPPFFKYSSPPQLRYPQLRYFCNYAILNWVQKKLELSYFLLFSPSYTTPYPLEEKIV